MFSDPKFKYVTISKKQIDASRAKVFDLTIDGKEFKGFVVEENGQYFAYHNVCKHLAVPLDLQGKNILNEDKTLLKCQMHGALYEKSTGKCIEGPCLGASLTPLEITDEEDEVVVRISKNT